MFSGSGSAAYSQAHSGTTTPAAPARGIWHSSRLATNPNPTTRSASSPVLPSSPSSSSSQMGQAFAKPNAARPPSPPPSSPSTTSRGLTAAMAGGIKLKRAFVGRRKKSEDAGKLMTNAVRDDSGSAHSAQPERHRSPFHGVEATPSSSSSPAQVMTHSVSATSSPNDAGHAVAAHETKHSSQLATYVFNAKRSSNSPLPIQPVPLQQPPVPPPKPTLVTASAAPNTSTPPRPAPLTVAPGYRSSIIPISPGISSAVNYMRMSEDKQRASDERRKDRETMEVVAAKVSDLGGAPEKSDFPDKDKDKAEMKDSWRKSDSTIGHGTIRAASSRPSRPVSMAESLQSTHTIVPVNKRLSALVTDADFGMAEEDDSGRSFEEFNISTSATSANDSLVERSAFMTQAASPYQASPTASIKTRNRRSMSLNITTHAAFSKSKVLPATTSISSTSASVTDLKQSMSEQSHMPPAMSPSMSREAPLSTRTPTNATGFIAPSSSGVQSTDNNIRGRLAAWSATTSTNHPPPSSPGSTSTHSQQHHPSTNPYSNTNTNNPYTTFPPPPSSAPTPISRLDRSLPALPPPPSYQRQPSPAPGSFRQTAISMTSGFAPAAGLAKRAVEKMGRAWGISSSSSHSNNSGYSSSSSSRGGTDNNANTPPSSFSSGGAVSQGHGHGLGKCASQELTRTNSTHSTGGGYHQYLHKKNRLRHTPNAPSVSSSITTASTASMSDSGGAPVGPVLGKRLRGPLRGKGGGGGVVFGRDLRTVVRETRVGVGKPRVWGGKWRNWDGEEEWEDGADSGRGEKDGDREESLEKGRERRGSVRRGQLKALEERKLPALVVRCAQHLLIWGVQEEGLFRVSGRPSHVSKLRAEFDSGADFDMTESSPGDLDPHAVASVFKAFLRELPEPILTYALHPYFDAAMVQESTNNATADGSQPQREGPQREGKGHSVGPGLPPHPRYSTNLPALRRPPSLSTLAMPAFTGMRPPSKTLLNTFQALVARLPEENRDLIRTVAELIKATARESKETKMPLSNLLLVFCPSLNMNPPLLRVLCEAEGIWDDEIMEIKKRDDEGEEHGDGGDADEAGEEEFEDAIDGMEEGYAENGESESVGRTSEDVPSSVEYHASTEDVASRVGQPERGPISTVYLDAEGSCGDDSSSMSQPAHGDIHVRGGSIVTSFLRDDGSSFLSASEDHHDNPSRHFSDVHSHSVSPPLLTSSAESLDTPATSAGHPSNLHLPIDKSPLDEDKAHPQHGSPFPIIAEASPMELSVPTPRRPVISHPIPITGPLEFPSSSVSDTTHAPDSKARLEKRHSISLLSFPNLSSGQLLGGSHDSAGSHDTSSSSSARGKRMKKPSLHLLFSKKSTSSLASPRTGSSPSLLRPMISSPYMVRSMSDSTASTPVSAFTAPQSSTFTSPPKLDTLIDSSSLRVGLGLGIEVIESPATPEKKEQNNARLKQPTPRHPISSLASASVPSLAVGLTPIADWFRAPSPSPGKKSSTFITPSMETLEDLPPASHLRPNPVARSRLTSTSSNASSNHLGMLDDQDPAEDWTRSVLLAADLEGGWVAQRSAPL